jgi:hypothetical protein
MELGSDFGARKGQFLCHSYFKHYGSILVDFGRILVEFWQHFSRFFDSILAKFNQIHNHTSLTSMTTSIQVSQA